MVFDDFLCDAESESCAPLRCSGDLHEALKNSLEIFLRDALTGILHGERYLIPARPRRDFYVSARRSVSNRVIYQVYEHSHDLAAVGINVWQGCREVDLQADAFLLGESADSMFQFAQDFGRSYGIEVRRHRPRLKLRDVQQVLGEFFKPFEILLLDRDKLLLALRQVAHRPFGKELDRE